MQIELKENMLMMTPREEEDQKRLHCITNPQALDGLFVGIYTSKTFFEGRGLAPFDKLDTDAVIKFYCTILSPYCSRQH